MLRFVNGEKKHKLLNYVFSIKIVKNTAGDKNDYIADPTQIFPKEACDQSILKSVQLFSFPDRAAIESRCFFTFVIGNPSTDFQLGFVLYYTYFDACCVLSDYYYPDMFNNLLSLERNEMLSVCEEMAKEKSYNFNDKTDYFVIKGKKYPLDGGRERQHLTKLLFTTFPAYDISKIIIGMLSARHVFVVAGNASTCSLFAAALPLLIEPFFWDLNLIPILPLKIIEMIDVPVPAMIGITRSELLQTQSIAPHICVNCDTKHVLDSPVFEQSNIGLRLEVVKKQIDFHSQVNVLLNEWKSSPGFPHKLVLEKVMLFVSYYLKLYTGECMSSSDFLALIKTKLPDYLLNSQIINQLLILDDLDSSKKNIFAKWFKTSFIKDAAEELKKNNELISERYGSQNPNLSDANSQLQTQPPQPIKRTMSQLNQQTQQQLPQSNQLRSSQPLTTNPQALQQKVNLGPPKSENFQTQGNRNPTNQAQFSTQPVNRPVNPFKSNTNSYPQKPPTSSASSYNQAGPLNQRPPLSSEPTSSSNNSPRTSTRPPNNTTNRSLNEAGSLPLENPFSTNNNKLNKNDAPENKNTSNNDNITLAQLSNVNDPDGDLLISFSGGNTPPNNSINNLQTSSVGSTAPPAPMPAQQKQTHANPPPTANFDIFTKYNQQKMQQQAQHNQLRQTNPISQYPQYRPNSTYQPNQQFYSQNSQFQQNQNYQQQNRYSTNPASLQNPFQSPNFQNKPQQYPPNPQNPQNIRPQQPQSQSQSQPQSQPQQQPQSQSQPQLYQYQQNQRQPNQQYPQYSQNPQTQPKQNQQFPQNQGQSNNQYRPNQPQQNQFFPQNQGNPNQQYTQYSQNTQSQPKQNQQFPQSQGQPNNQYQPNQQNYQMWGNNTQNNYTQPNNNNSNNQTPNQSQQNSNEPRLF